jgi:glyoxylase-like metal-dependent hydrolase (beta-lactamase superfamily II)
MAPLMTPFKTSLDLSQGELGLRVFRVGWLKTNCFALWGRETGPCLVIDPGDDANILLDFLRQQRLTLQAILNTHGHPDHIGANGPLQKAFGAQIWIHPADAPWLEDPAANLSGGREPSLASPRATRALLPGQEITCGPWRLQVLATPGHTPGSVCLMGNHALFSGDTLFAGSVGRTDLPGGDARQLRESLRTQILPLPPSLTVYPGHGPFTTLEQEFQTNPYLASGGGL